MQRLPLLHCAAKFFLRQLMQGYCDIGVSYQRVDTFLYLNILISYYPNNNFINIIITLFTVKYQFVVLLQLSSLLLLRICYYKDLYTHPKTIHEERDFSTVECPSGCQVSACESFLTP